MSTIEVDVAVIGAGTAGLAAYRAAIAAGKTAVIIEGGPYGTTCARVGCMPSKLLIAAAEAAHATQKWAEFGLRLHGEVEVDGKAVMARVKRERDRFVGFVTRGVDGIPAQHKLRGFARFVDDRTLEVNERRVRFGRAVIATGSSPCIPPLLRAAGDRLIVNDDIFDWDALPRSVAVFGPGVIGLELGQALHRLGVVVHMFGRGGSVGPFTDPALRAYAEKTFRGEFFLDADAEVQRIERITEGVRIRYVDSNAADRSTGVGEIVVDYVIAATGRAPNVRNLGLEHTAVKLLSNGVPRFDRRTLRCGDTNIFIAGDANNDLPLLHEAADEGRIAGTNAANYPVVEPGLRRAPLAIVFSDPQLAVVGQRFADLDPSRIVIGEVSFEDQGRSRVMLRNVGLLHVYADVDTGVFLGAEMIGPDAEHIGHLLAWALQSGLTIAEMLDMPFYHPLVQEGLRTALRDAQARLEQARLEKTAPSRYPMAA
ncbi:MAG TPA: dihydrolipoyl dehydrogenase [Burkholderiales bacterium]|nr:dihydrolipoyl dehydrogenase [Burkholderiales bacterium]